MADIAIINDVKTIENLNDEESYNNKNNNNSIEKLDNQYNSDNSEDKNINSKTNFTEIELKNNCQNEENLKKKSNIYSLANTTTKKSNNYDTKKNSVLQEKLKKIFMVREKGKFEYNKQEIPENLKYHSDSDSSEISELRNSKKLKLNNDNYTNSNNNNQINSRISVKRQNRGFSSKELSFNNKNIKKEKNNEKNSEEENNSPNLPKNTNNVKKEITPILEEKNNQNKEKKFNNFNKKILDNYINEMNKTENNEKKENNQNTENKKMEKSEKKEGKTTAIKDIIEKLKAKKIEKEELGKKEKEAEEQSIMRRKDKNKDKKEINKEDKKNDEIQKNKKKETQKEIKKSKIENKKENKEKEGIKKEKEEEKIIESKEEERINRDKERKKEEILKRIKMDKSKDKNKRYKRSTEIRQENLILLPHKTFRDETDEEDEINYFIKKQSSDSNKSKNKNNTKEKNIRRKQLELDIKNELNKEELEQSNNLIKVSNNKNNNRQRLNSNELIPRPINKNKSMIDTNKNAYKKPLNKIPTNSRALNVYRPKKAGAIRGRSLEKTEPPNLLLNKINNQAFNNSSNNIFSTLANNNSNKNEKNINSKITYTKKRSPVKETRNFVQLNNSFNNNKIANNSMLGKKSINSLEINNINNLNSSFDSSIKNFGTNSNNLLYGINLNNSFFNNATNNSNVYSSGRITNSSFLNSDNISNLNLNNFNTNNSLIPNIIHQQFINYEPNSSFSYGYNNSFVSNILNNSCIGINNLNNSFQRNNNNYSLSINIEDLLVLEEKLSEIIITLNKSKITYNECFEFWNYYYNCSLYCRLEKLFTNIYESNNVQLAINYLLMSIMISYDFSFDIKIINNSYSILDELLKLNHQNLIIIFEHILTKISSDSRDNIWVFRLNTIVNSSKNSKYNDKYSTINEYSMSPAEKINFNTGIIIQNIRVLLKNYKTAKIDKLTSIFKKLNEKTYEDINIFFRENILRVDNMNGSVLASIFLKENNNFKTEPAPYLKTINRKPYSLILDLDETLVHFKVNPDNESEGVLRVRPGIIEFLDSIDKYYELIIFTAATQEYADLLIDAVEENKIYFEHRLYRQHTVIVGNDFVKDLSRVGRPLDKIAIVDNMPQNFRLQKENGINIKAFWGEEVYDTALIDLAPILINIAKEGGDIRDGLAKYKDEIVKKVTSNISKHTPS